jgi:predicted SnoaL-like aldol condensation-catalyzing enzyme
MDATDENKHVVLRQIEALNAGDVEASFAMAHPDLFDHDAGRIGDYRDTVRRLHDRFADCRVEPLDIVAEDDRVAVRVRIRVDGTSSQQIHIWRLSDGRIVEHWSGDRLRPLEEEA